MGGAIWGDYIPCPLNAENASGTLGTGDPILLVEHDCLTRRCGFETGIGESQSSKVNRCHNPVSPYTRSPGHYLNPMSARLWDVRFASNQALRSQGSFVARAGHLATGVVASGKTCRQPAQGWTISLLLIT